MVVYGEKKTLEKTEADHAILLNANRIHERQLYTRIICFCLFLLTKRVYMAFKFRRE